MHKALFQKAKEAVDRRSDVSLETVDVCHVCGYPREGEAPDRCPVCKAPKDKFTAFGGCAGRKDRPGRVTPGVHDRAEVSHDS